jgi:hypothetical protein
MLSFDHSLDTHALASGVVVGECSCGHWEMRVGPDALVGHATSLEELLEQVHTIHQHEM